MILFYTENTLGAVFQGLETTLATPFRGGTARGHAAVVGAGGDALSNNFPHNNPRVSLQHVSSSVGNGKNKIVGQKCRNLYLQTSSK